MGVAVLIAAKNASATVARAIRSALLEGETAEVVVVDDASTDGTWAAASAADDGSCRLRLVRQPGAGPSAARNCAYDLSSSPFVCVLDADDFFLPGRLGRIFRETTIDWDMAADRVLLAREGAEAGPYEPWGGRIPADGIIDFRAFVLGNITDPARPRTELGYLQPVFRRDFLDRHGLRYNETVRLGEDYLLYAEALALGARFQVVPSAGYVAVSRAGSLSHRHTAADLYALLEADRRLLAALPLSDDDRRALLRHVRSVRERWAYHFALEAKARRGLTRALPRLLLNLDVLGYSVRQTLRSRFSAGGGRGLQRQAR